MQRLYGLRHPILLDGLYDRLVDRENWMATLKDWQCLMAIYFGLLAGKKLDAPKAFDLKAKTRFCGISKILLVAKLTG